MTEETGQSVPPYSWYALGVLFLVYLLNFVDRQIRPEMDDAETCSCGEDGSR